MDIKSGNDNFRFRRVHQIMVFIQHLTPSIHIDMCASLESVGSWTLLVLRHWPLIPEQNLNEACVKSCQEWFIAVSHLKHRPPSLINLLQVLDEAAKLPTKSLQLQFLDANKAYMVAALEIHAIAFRKVSTRYAPSKAPCPYQYYLQMGIESSIHICSLHCKSHVQPTWEALFVTGRDALDNLFLPPTRLLRCIRECPPDYPTREHLFYARLVGLTQFHIYFSYLVMPESKRNEASSTSLIARCNRLHAG